MTIKRTSGGGCLTDYQTKWKEMGANKFVLKTITGSRIPFMKKPPLIYPSTRVIQKFATKPSPEMSRKIWELKNLNILETPIKRNPSYFSRMFLVKKSDGGLRPIIDLRGLNKYVKTKPFHLISQASVPNFLQQDDWLVKIDLSQAYFHIPIAHSHRPFLRVSYLGEILQMTCLPFGLSSAPRLFAAITCWIAEILRKRGGRVLVYLDDFLLAHQDRTILSFQAAEAVELLSVLGWQVNSGKSIIVPTQNIEFLGLIWKTHENIISLPTKKRIIITTVLEKMLRIKACNLRQLQHLLGLLNFACMVVARGRLHCRHMQMMIRQFQNDPRRVVCIANAALTDMRWWLGALVAPAVPIHLPKIHHFLSTDASDMGWGAQLDQSHLAGCWRKRQKSWHSNKKEMYAVLSAIKTLAPRLKDSHILLQTDNRTLIAYIRKEGGTRSIGLLALTFQLLVLLDQWNIILSAQYLPGRYNLIADRLSRRRPIPEWHLLPPATSEVFALWGTPSIDLFASKRSTVVGKYVSIDAKDRGAEFIDAFSRDWDYQLAWIFPPPSLIPRVLAHLNRARGTYLLVAPDWERPFWKPDLVNRAQDPPRVIPNLREVLIDLTTGFPPPFLDQLTLQVWKVGGGQKG